MKILITGGTGFIGSALALKNLADGNSVVALGRENPTPTEKWNFDRIESAGGTIGTAAVSSQEDLQNAMHDVDVVYHLAAAQHEMNIPDEVFEAVNVTGTRSVFEAALAQGVKRVIHGSTIGVYGRDCDVVDENSKLDPDNIYGRTKAEGEKVVHEYFDRIPSTIIRISETYGPGDRRLLKLFKAISKRMFLMIGKGLNLHQLIYVDDLVDGLMLAASNSDCDGETILLAGHERLTSNDMTDHIAAALDVKPRSVHAPLFVFMTAAAAMELVFRPLGIQPPLHRRRMDFFTRSFCIDTGKAESVLQFQPKVDFKTGTRRSAEWYNEHGML